MAYTVMMGHRVETMVPNTMDAPSIRREMENTSLNRTMMQARASLPWT